MENQLCARDWLDYLEAIGPLIAALIACGLAWWQGWIQSKQKEISLYEKRYKLLYLPMLSYLDHIIMLHNKFPNVDMKEHERYSKKFIEKIDYGRFLIKKNDFTKLIELLEKYNNESYSCIEKIQNSADLQKMIEIRLERMNKLERIKTKMVNILFPYLQI